PLAVSDGRSALVDAQSGLEQALQKLESQFGPSAAGLGITVAWGLPYFRAYVPKLAGRHIPVDRRATKTASKPVRVLLDPRRVPRGSPEIILAANDDAVLPL